MPRLFAVRDERYLQGYRITCHEASLLRAAFAVLYGMDVVGLGRLYFSYCLFSLMLFSNLNKSSFDSMSTNGVVITPQKGCKDLLHEFI